MKKTTAAALIGVLLTLAVLTGCEKKTASPAKGENTLVRIVLDWTPNTNHTGIYVAKDKLWFAEEGLDVEILMPPEDGALVLLGAGRAEFAVDFQESLGPAIARDGDALPVTAVAAVISHNTSGLMSLKKAGIRRPADLAGKRFASWETPMVTAVIKDIVEADGGDFSRVTMVPNMAADAFSALETDVDSIWIYYAWDGVAAEVLGKAIDYIDLGKVNPALDFYTPVIVTNTAWAASHPAGAKKFMKALSRGYEFAVENPDEAAEILLANAPELDRELVLRSQRYLAPRYRDDAPRWGEIDARRWGSFYRWMFERGLLEKDIGEGGFSNEYLP
ncbi:MAG: ABC transporter substrate-binding protein [Treponema sp.]|jgi:ABC-type nitrate/sulfonate/bicarbonate transport system substrate-binding protein|nr:ABC transporter substrate-binding protein [Treponema sp.]